MQKCDDMPLKAISRIHARARAAGCAIRRAPGSGRRPTDDEHPEDDRTTLSVRVSDFTITRKSRSRPPRPIHQVSGLTGRRPADDDHHADEPERDRRQLWPRQPFPQKRDRKDRRQIGVVNSIEISTASGIKVKA